MNNDVFLSTSYPKLDIKLIKVITANAKLGHFDTAINNLKQQAKQDNNNAVVGIVNAEVDDEELVAGYEAWIYHHDN